MTATNLEQFRNSWKTILPASLTERGGKMSELDSVKEFAQIREISEAIASLEPYESAGRMGAADYRMINSLRAAKSEGYSHVVYIWDNSTGHFVITADGSSARLLK